MTSQHAPSLRCQAYWQNAQSQRYNQILPKSLPAPHSPTHEHKDDAAKIKDRISKDKNGQLVTTGGIFYCRVSGYFSVSASDKLSCILTEQCFEIGDKNIPPIRYQQSTLYHDIDFQS